MLEDEVTDPKQKVSNKEEIKVILYAKPSKFQT